MGTPPNPRDLELFFSSLAPYSPVASLLAEKCREPGVGERSASSPPVTGSPSFAHHSNISFDPLTAIANGNLPIESFRSTDPFQLLDIFVDPGTYDPCSRRFRPEPFTTERGVKVRYEPDRGLFIPTNLLFRALNLLVGDAYCGVSLSKNFFLTGRGGEHPSGRRITGFYGWSL